MCLPQHFTKPTTELLDIRHLDGDKVQLNDNQRSSLAKDLKVEITHSQIARKYRVCNLTRRSAQMQCFPLQLENGQTVECTVAKLFLDRYGLKPRYPGPPACRWARSTSAPTCP